MRRLAHFLGFWAAVGLLLFIGAHPADEFSLVGLAHMVGGLAAIWSLPLTLQGMLGSGTR